MGSAVLSLIEISLQTMETLLEGCEFGCAGTFLLARAQMPVVVLPNAVWCLFPRLAFLMGVELFHAECSGIVEECEFGCRCKCLRVREFWGKYLALWRQMPLVVGANAFECVGGCLWLCWQMLFVVEANAFCCGIKC